MSKGTRLSDPAAIGRPREVQAEHRVFSSIGDLLAHHGRHSPASPAILAPGGTALTYGAFWTGVNEIVSDLRSFGIGRGDRVAVVLPMGAEAAVATVAVAAGAVCVPLHPGFAAEEWRRYFADLRVAALLTRTDVDSTSRSVAYRLGIPVIDLAQSPGQGPGAFKLVCPTPRPAVIGDFAISNLATGTDDAFMLLTSGTTSRPKLVPLTHASVCLSAYNVGAAVALDLGTRGGIGKRIERSLPAKIRCRGFLRLAETVPTNLVHGRPADPSRADLRGTRPQAELSLIIPAADPISLVVAASRRAE
jgi:acyl-CoA synthetase (AMP-forming)/AMP-acid ligase II